MRPSKNAEGVKAMVVLFLPIKRGLESQFILKNLDGMVYVIFDDNSTGGGGAAVGNWPS